MGISILAWLSSLDPYWPSTPSRDHNQANMEMPMYWVIKYSIKAIMTSIIFLQSLDFQYIRHITFQSKKLKDLMFTHCLLGNTFKYMVEIKYSEKFISKKTTELFVNYLNMNYFNIIVSINFSIFILYILFHKKLGLMKLVVTSI